MSEKKTKVTVTVEPIKVGRYPKITIFNVEILREIAERHDESWTGTLSSPEQANAFLRGLEAGATMFANLRPRVPFVTSATQEPVSKVTEF